MRKSVFFRGVLARPERFELPTPWFVARYSIQLSYGRASRGARILPHHRAAPPGDELAERVGIRTLEGFLTLTP